MFDACATGNPNLDLLASDKMKYLSQVKLNQNDVGHHLNTFSKDKWKRVITGNKNEEVYWKKLVLPVELKYLYFSQTLYDEIMKNRWKRLERDYDDALSLRKTIETGKKPRKKYR